MIWDKLIKIDAITSKYFWLLAIIAITIGLIIGICSCSHTYKQPHYVPKQDCELMRQLANTDTIIYKRLR
jgi:hypothetical protein